MCQIENYENKVHARGWCEKHYTRWRRYGDVNIVKIELCGYRYHPL